MSAFLLIQSQAQDFFYFLLQPSFEKKFQAKRLRSCIKHWNVLFRDQIQKTSKAWWERFAQQVEKMEASSVFRTKQGSVNAHWILSKLPKLRATEDDSNGQAPPEELVRMVAEERQQREVVLFLPIIFK